MEIFNEIISKIILDEENQGSILANNARLIEIEKELCQTKNLDIDLLEEFKSEIIESFLCLKEKDCEKVLKIGIALGMEIQKETNKKD